MLRLADVLRDAGISGDDAERGAVALLAAGIGYPEWFDELVPREVLCAAECAAEDAEAALHDAHARNAELQARLQELGARVADAEAQAVRPA